MINGISNDRPEPNLVRRPKASGGAGLGTLAHPLTPGLVMTRLNATKYINLYTPVIDYLRNIMNNIKNACIMSQM